MAVDTSMYQNAPKPVNALEMATGVAGLQGAILGNQRAGMQNQLLQRDMASRKAVGEAAQGAVDPATGQIDPNKFMGAVAGNPDAAYGAVDAAQNATALNAAQLAQHIQKVDLAFKQTGYLAQQLGSLADKKGVSSKDVSSLAGTLVQNGILDPKAAASELAGMPTDAAQLPGYLRGLQKRAMDSMTQLGLYHNKVMSDNGAALVPTNTAPLGEQGPVVKTLSPEAAASPVAGPVDASGAPTTIPLGQRAGMGAVKVGLSPSESAAQGVTGGSNAQMGVDLGKMADQMPDVKGMLGNMSGDLSSFTTGPGAHNWKSFLAGAARLGIPVDTNAVASQENFNKISTMLAQRQFAALGGTGTDRQLGSAIDSNPHDALSKLGNQRIIAMLKGNADAITLKNQLWQRWQQAGHSADSYQQFTTSFNKRYDPRVFQFNYMDNGEKAKALTGMAPAEKKQFQDQYNYAVSKGWVPDPREGH